MAGTRRISRSEERESAAEGGHGSRDRADGECGKTGQPGKAGPVDGGDRGWPELGAFRDRKNENPRLKEGMVLAIEPMVNAGKPGSRVKPDRWTAVTEDGRNSAHFEIGRTRIRG